MEKKQTAVEWLESKMTEYLQNIYKSEIEQAKEIEKQQIIDATIYGNRQEFYDGTEIIGSKYYDETYKKK